ncbi:Hypothetical protein NocV09_08500040 [Nannochloropsis oceanica]
MDAKSFSTPVASFTAAAKPSPLSSSPSSLPSPSPSSPTAQPQKPLYKPFSSEEHTRFLTALDSLLASSSSLLSTSPLTENEKQQAWTGLEWSDLAARVGNERSVMEVKLHAHECFLRLQAKMGASPESSPSHLSPALSAGQKVPQQCTKKKEEEAGEDEEVGMEAGTSMEEQERDEKKVEEGEEGKTMHVQQVEEVQMQKEEKREKRTEAHEEGQEKKENEKEEKEGETGEGMLHEKKEEEEDAPAARDVEMVVAMTVEAEEPDEMMREKKEKKQEQKMAEKEKEDDVAKEETVGGKRKAGDKMEGCDATAGASTAVLSAKRAHSRSNDTIVEKHAESSLPYQEEKENGGEEVHQ